MHIAIIGPGKVGRTLADGWVARGHRVTFGVRDVASPKLADIDRARFAIAPNADAVADADAIVLATPWAATRAAIEACGDLAGRVVLDATNPLLPNYGGLDHAQAGGRSGGERVAEWAAGAKVVKVFNTTGFNNMANTRYGDDGVMMLLCGDDAGAKAVARTLAADLGFDPVDFGPLAHAGLSENVAWTWIWLAVKSGIGRDIGFVLKRR